MAKTLPFGAPLGPCFDSIAKVLVLVIVKVNIEKKGYWDTAQTMMKRIGMDQ